MRIGLAAFLLPGIGAGEASEDRAEAVGAVRPGLAQPGAVEEAKDSRVGVVRHGQRRRRWRSSGRPRW
mgnify:CR=1 FL=1